MGNFYKALLILLISLPTFAEEYIVKYKTGSIFTLNFMEGVEVLDQYNKARLVKVDVDKNNIQTLSTIMNRDDVEYVVKNFKLKKFKNSLSETQLRDQWANTKVNLARAWELAGNRGSKNITVAVIDTGVDYRHESLRTNTVPGYDFKDKDDDPMDDTGFQNPGHGTHCSGSIAGNGLVEGGIEGAAPNISLMPIRFLGANGGGDLMDGIRSIDYAIEKKVEIISASWGATISKQQAQPLIEAVQRASDAGIAFVVAAANDGKNNDTTGVYPANAITDNTITVAASDSSDSKASFSNYGRRMVSIAAPGVDIMSTLPSNKYGNLSGTSMATPLVAGVVALLKSQNPGLTGKQIKALIQKTGQSVDIQTECNCRIDAAAAMDYVVNNKSWLAPSAFTLSVGEERQMELVNSSGSVTYESTNPSVLSVDANGLAKAVAEGEAVINATDATGNTVSTLNLTVANGSQDGGGGTPGEGECPIGDPALCQIACEFEPTLPWCQ